MKTVDVNPGMHIHFNKRNNKEDPEFEVGNHLRISKYKDIFTKSYFPIWSKKAFVITKVKNAVLWTHVICDLIGNQIVTCDVKGEQIVGNFYKKELQKTDQKRVGKVINRKDNKWKRYDNSFNSWIDKKDVV